MHDNLSSSQFERLVYRLLDKMGFSETQLTAKSGDGEIDLKATWTQTEVPGLRIDLGFVIQAKRFDPGRSLNPRIVRELRGSLVPGEWGLLITTARVTAQTREDGLRDPSRIVSVIDGGQLLYLCQEYEVGFRKNYQFDASLIDPPQEDDSPPATEPPRLRPSDLSDLLLRSIGEKFDRIGHTPIYKSRDKNVLARWSQRYQRKTENHWYGLTAKDIASVQEDALTHFAYVCGSLGTILLPVDVVLAHIRNDELGVTLRDGNLRHYHIFFLESDDGMLWVMKEGKSESVQHYFSPLKEKQLVS
jgi:hypothetical protein